MPFVCVVRLSRFVIFPSDDQNIVLALVVIRAVEPDVVIRILGVPVEGLCHRAVRHFDPNHIGHVRSLLGMYGDEVIDRGVCRHHHCVSSDHLTARCNARRRTAVDLVGVGLGENPPAGAHDRFAQPR
jgi:hypothetical protein